MPVNNKETKAPTPPSVAHPAHAIDDTPSSWTDWMPGAIEKQQLSMTVSGAVVKSYIVRARRPDNRWVKVRVIPYFGELRVPDFRYTGHARIRRPETTPRELVERMMRTANVWVGISTDIVSRITGAIERSVYIWYGVALAHVDHRNRTKHLVTAFDGPYDDVRERSCLSIVVPDDVPLLQGSAENLRLLVTRQAAVWKHPPMMQTLLGGDRMAMRRPEAAVSICVEPPAEGGERQRFTRATIRHICNPYSSYQ
ncbi:hypothetical protein FOMPIDRAFT_1051650 [Fomitopsis schrenkii]|uniref:Uncharacterized protein n=1 Tax=Fomitopsis schrenkii TaxID=2126942 RepID=S8F9J6_FOMSC|nr:hypothetical protein FOMPIDRAFT_1051650 [Fomitopsis schrenkii]